MLSPAKTAISIGLAVLVMAMSQLPGCSRQTKVQEFTLETLGTFAQISIAGLEREQAEAAAARAQQAFDALGQIGFTFHPGSELHRINEALAQGRSIAVSAELLELLVRAQELSQASSGLFNPAAGELTALWEYHCEQDECSDAPHYPDEVRKLVEQKLASVLKHPPSMNDLVIRGNRVSSRNRQVRLEFGDIIRGLALDHGISALQQAGAGNAMIDIGGSIHSSGSRGEHAWWIGILDATGKRTIGSIEANTGDSVFTARSLDISIGGHDRIYRRVTDPRTGMPVQDVSSVTVIHSSALVANAAATAFMVAGPDDWKNVAQRMGVHAVIMITSNGTIYTSPAIEHRIHWKQGITHQHLVP